MSGIKKYDYTTLKQAIMDYTEVSSDVFTTTILDGFIMSAEFRIYQELPMDSARFVQEGTLAANEILLMRQQDVSLSEELKSLNLQLILKVMENG